LVIPVARPVRDSYEALFKAAAEEFAAQGFDAAGVDKIAARAGVNKAMLYYHFGSKRALYLEILRQMFRAVGVRARAIADGPETAEAKIDAWIAAIVEEAAARPWFPSIMLRELASGAPRFDPDTFAMMNAVFAAVHDIIRQGQREGRFRDVDPLLTHLTIMPAILMFFARQRVLAATRLEATGVAEPRQQDQFVCHMQDSVRRILRKDV
jgi:TetR/AcrR family transcriptional regulator